MKVNKKNLCPFGLPITLACKKIGNYIKKMKEVVSKDGEENLCNMEHNWKVMFHSLSSGDSSRQTRCPYASAIGNCATECSYYKDTSEDEATQLSIDGSPTQINMFDTNPINNGLPLYGDSTVYDDNIREVPLGLANVGKDYPNIS